MFEYFISLVLFCITHPEALIYALFVGFLPALIWLWFWLHEDSERPEPRSILAFTFTTGMAMIFLAIPLEAFFYQTIQNTSWRFFAWASVEEILKFTAAYIVAIQTKAFDEPLDAIIYMICAALGFAALENTLFIIHSVTSIDSIIGSGILSTVFLTNIRFIGANLLHVVASSTIGVALAWSFYKSRLEKILWTTGGIAVAIMLHTIFNLFIIDSSPTSIFLVFSIVWLTMVAFILIFEKIKKINVPVSQQIIQQ